MQRLFRGESDPEVFGKVLAGCSTPPSAVVPALAKSFDDVVMRGLSIDPEKRFPTARDMARQLERCVGIATPTDVSDWLEVHAAELLKGRAKRVSALESSSGVLLPGRPPAIRSDPPPGGAPQDQHTVVSDVRDTAAPPQLPMDYPIDVDADASSLGDPLQPAAAVLAEPNPTIPVPPIEAEPAQREVPLHLEFQPPIPWAKWGVVAGGVALMLVGLVLLLRSPAPPTAAAQPSASASAEAPAAAVEPSVTREPDRAAPASTPIIVPTVTVGGQAPPPDSVAQPAPQPPTTAVASPQPKVPLRPVVTPAPVKPAGGDCNPPYYFDASGKKHYKRQCG